MSTTTKDITAEQWLDIRDEVAKAVKAGATPNTRTETTVAIAERLLRKGYVDIDAVLEAIAPAKPKAGGVAVNLSKIDRDLINQLGAKA